MLIDNDRKFRPNFDAMFGALGTEVKGVGPRAPNSYPERWVQTLRKECLYHFVIRGERHLAHFLREFVAHNQERPHQARGNVPLPDADVDEPRILPFPSGEVRCRGRLGGLLKHSYRAVA